ncbi:MAG TPA: hypothetical protein V6D47_20870, partial [Oscillatoriaceae cyanobacterium]
YVSIFPDMYQWNYNYRGVISRLARLAGVNERIDWAKVNNAIRWHSGFVVNVARAVSAPKPVHKPAARPKPKPIHTPKPTPVPVETPVATVTVPVAPTETPASPSSWFDRDASPSQ